jgi:hypothetical protein
METGKVGREGGGEEEYQNNGRSDPERAIKVRVTLKDVKEVCAGKEGGPAAAEDLVGIDVEELGVEGEAPQELLAAVVTVVARGGRREEVCAGAGGGGGDLALRLVGGVVCGVAS